MNPSKHVVESNPDSYAAEAYRMLRNNLQYITAESGASSITITSSKTDEGKSTVAGNIAIALSQAGKSTLLVDCDLRNPSLHKAFGIINNKGLTNILADDVKFLDCTVRYSESLSLITSGNSEENISELFLSKNMLPFMKWSKNSFDYVILDTPPVTMVSDTQVIAAMSDGVLLVAAQGKADLDSLGMAKELLMGIKANIIGTILNKADYKPKSGYYYNGKRKKKKVMKKEALAG